MTRILNELAGVDPRGLDDLQVKGAFPIKDSSYD
jgi:hypothetical protein